MGYLDEDANGKSSEEEEVDATRDKKEQIFDYMTNIMCSILANKFELDYPKNNRKKKKSLPIFIIVKNTNIFYRSKFKRVNVRILYLILTALRMAYSSARV